jgi:signal transduction histidine kinase
MLTFSVSSGCPSDGSAGSSLADDPAMLTGLIHDLRQPLSVIEMCADYLNLILPAGEPQARQQLELLQQQVDEAGRILCEALHLLKLSYVPAGPELATAPAAASRLLTKAASAAVAY